MATQAIRFIGPPGQAITLDVFTLDSDIALFADVVCTEEANRKGLYLSADFTATLTGRHYVVKKIGGVAVGNDFVDMLDATDVYDSVGLREAQGVIQVIKADPDLGTAPGGMANNSLRSRQFVTNRRTRTVIGPRQIRYTVRNDDDTADEFEVDYDPLTGNMSPV